MKQKVIRYLVMICALGVFMYAAYQLTLIYIESKESVEVYEEVKSLFLTEDAEGAYETDAHGKKIKNKSNGKKFVWDYEKMLDYNSDSLGYIRQDNGDYIDNPILQYSDNDYYLNHLADHTVSSVGSIYVDYRIKDGLDAKNPIVYGHNMGTRVNNIMFGTLNWYYYRKDDPNYYKKHPTFDIYVGYKHYKYYVFAVYKTEATGGWTYQYEFENDETFLNYVNECKKRSRYEFEKAGEITAEDKIITLSTCCESDDYRMIVQAVRREEIDDVPNVPEDADSVLATRKTLTIGEQEDTSVEETTTVAEAETESVTEAETPTEEETEEATEETTTKKKKKKPKETTTKKKKKPSKEEETTTKKKKPSKEENTEKPTKETESVEEEDTTEETTPEEETTTPPEETTTVSEEEETDEPLSEE